MLFGLLQLILQLLYLVVQIIDFVLFLLCCLEVVLEFIVLFHELIVLEFARIKKEITFGRFRLPFIYV